MKPENEMNEEIQQLLNSLEEHGKNVRRQKKLSDLMDRLAEEEKTVEQSCQHRKHTPLWWIIGAAAACLLLWLLVKPTMKQAPEMKEEILVEETKTIDSIKTKVNDVVLENPVIHEELLAEGMSVVPQKPQTNKEKPKEEIIEEVVEQPVLAEVIPTAPKDTTNMESNTIPTVNETPVDNQKPQRRVIRSLNLVCYECRKEPEYVTKTEMENRTIFGQPQDPNMKNGSLAFELKLH